MADSTQQPSSSTANPWLQYIMPTALQNASGNALKTDTNSLLNFGDNQNLQSSDSSNTTTNPLALSSQQTQPNSDAGNSSSSTAASSAPGATSNSNATGTSSPNYATTLINTGNKSGNGQSQQTGMPSGAFNNAVSAVSNSIGLKGQGSSLVNGVKSDINNFGQTLGFGTGANTDLSQGFGIGANTNLAQGFGDDADVLSQGFDPDVVATGFGADAGAFTGTSLSGVLGGAGLGALGGGLLAGAIGGNKIGGSIGGGIGGALGSAAAGALGGTELGAMLGSWAGPVGTAIGAIGGSLLGSVFGNTTKPTSASEFGETLTPNASNLSPTFGSKNNDTGFSQTMSGSVNTMLQQASSALGINFGQVGLHGGYNSLYSGGGQSDPGFISVNGGSNISFNPTDPTSTSNAMYSALTQIAGASGYTNTQDLYNWFYGQGSVSTGASGTNNAFTGSSSPVTIAPKV